MMLRTRLVRLSRPAARRAFGRAWLGVCLVGAFVTLVALGPSHLFIVLTLWLVCIFAPVRIAVELLHTLGPRLRNALRLELEQRGDRYATRDGIALMTEMLFERAVRLPRLAPPDLAAKVIDAAAGITGRAYRTGDGPGGVRQAAYTYHTLLERWVGAIQAGEDTPPRTYGPARPNGAAPPTLWNPGASIQDQWITLRAVAGLAALTNTLVAIYEDGAGRPLEDGAAIRATADAAMDFADQLGLQLEGPRWDAPSGVTGRPLDPDTVARLAETWLAFCQAPQPAPRRLLAFLNSTSD